IRGMSVEGHAVSELRLQCLPEAVAQGAHAIHRREIARKLAGLAETDRKQRALGPGATTALVPGTVNERLDRQPITHEQRADALWGIELVTGNRQEIDAELLHVGRNLADGLGGIGMEQHAVR